MTSSPEGMDELLAEATRLGAELEELVERASSVSEQIDQAVVDAVRHTGQIGLTLFRAGAPTRAVVGATGVGLGVAAVAWAVGKLTQAKQAEEERRRLIEVGKKKKAIAEQKAASLELLLPKLERLRQRFEAGLRADSGRQLSPDLWPRAERLRDGLVKLFGGLLECERRVAVAKYLRAEFAAWMKGESSSFQPRPDGEVSRDRCAYAVIESAALPARPRAMAMPEHFTVGTYLLLAQPPGEVPEDVAAEIGAVRRAIGVGRVVSTLNPFSATAKRFREFDRALLRGDRSVAKEANRVWFAIGVGTAAVVAASAALLL